MHPVELAGEASNERNQIVHKLFLYRVVCLVFDDRDGDAETVEIPLQIGDAKAGESILVGAEDTAIVGCLDLVTECLKPTSVFIKSAADISVGVFDAPPVCMSVFSEFSSWRLRSPFAFWP